MEYKSETVLEIPFHDVDMMKVAWHGHYFKYFEIARCALLDSIDYNYVEMERSGYAWPVVDARVRYAKPLFFQQKIKIIAKLVEWENRLKVEYVITDIETGTRLTKGYTVQVAVDLNSREMLYASPDVLFARLGLEP